MKFFSTNRRSDPVDLRTAVLKGLADDGGLFMPERVPLVPRGFVDHLGSRTLQEIAFEVSSLFTYGEIKSADLSTLIERAIAFDAPLTALRNNIFSLELFHGPTLAFKDFGARFMAQLLSHYVANFDREIVILVATSGDTGTAVAHGFLGAEGIKVVILYPSGKVSPTQEAQLTTCGKNITALEVDGTFDDCQRFAKRAFSDPELCNKRTLTSANSINIARLIPQSFYYFYGVGQLKDRSRPPIISVPSGNFGNLTAGIFAKHMGLPIRRFVAATNANDVVPKYLMSGNFQPRPSIETISNAMDVGNPSNFARILSLYDGSLEKIRSEISGYSFSDRETAEAIRTVYDDQGYLLDPHGAVGFLGLKKESSGKESGIFLECAHPGKFHEKVSDIIGEKVELPSALRQALSKEKKALKSPPDYERIRELIIEST